MSIAAAQPANQILPRPFPAVGAHIGLHETINGQSCSGESTLKAKNWGGNKYVLSNNHILGCNNGGGVEVDQPGLSALACQNNSNCSFGVVHSYIDLIPDYNYNETDAALSTAIDHSANNTIYGFTKDISTVVQTTPVLGETVGFINSQASVNGYSNLIVCSIVFVARSLSADYSCAANGGVVTPCCFDIPADDYVGFVNQIQLQCPVSVLHGDSGALVFSAYDQCNMPIGILWAGFADGVGKSLQDVAPILPTLQGLGVSVNGPNVCQSNPPYGPVTADHILGLSPRQPLNSSRHGRAYAQAGDPTRNSPYHYRLLTPAEQAQAKAIGETIDSPDFENTRDVWEDRLGMHITSMGAGEMPDRSFKFSVGVDAGGRPIPDVLPHTFMGVPVVVQDQPPAEAE